MATPSAKKVLAENLKQRAHKADLAAAMVKDGHEIDKKYITIAGGTVKRTGTANAKVRLHRDVIVDLPFEVVAEAKK